MSSFDCKEFESSKASYFDQVYPDREPHGNHMSHLLQLSQNSLYFDIVAQANEDSEPLAPWQTPASEPVTVVKNLRRRKHERGGAESNQSAAFTSRLWKDSIEEHSYRYISSNGCYRNHKNSITCNKHTRNSSKQRPPHPSVSNQKSQLSTEQRQLQRELTKDLRKQLQTLMSTNGSYFRLDNSIVVNPSRAEDDTDDKQQEQKEPELFSAENSKLKERQALDDLARGMETKSAQPFLHASEYLEALDYPRSLTGLDYTKLQDLRGARRSDANTSNDATNGINKKQRKLPALDRPPLPNVKMGISGEDQVAALAKQTLYVSKNLKPIDPIHTQRDYKDEQLRNSISVDSPYQVHNASPICTEITAKSIFPSDFAQPSIPFYSTNSHAIRVTQPPLSLSSTTYKYKLGDTKPKLPPPIAKNSSREFSQAEDFQTFLPTISGKRISTKLASFR